MITFAWSYAALRAVASVVRAVAFAPRSEGDDVMTRVTARPRRYRIAAISGLALTRGLALTGVGAASALGATSAPAAAPASAPAGGAGVAGGTATAPQI